MPVDFLANAKPVAAQSDFLANATPVSQVAGLPAGVDLPTPAAHGAPPKALQGPVTPTGMSQASFDANTRTSPDDPLLETGLKSVVGTIGTPFVHPLQTGKALLQSIPHLSSQYDPQNPLAAPIVQAVMDYQDAGGGAHGTAYAGTKALGSTFGGMALGEAGAAPLRFVNKVVAPAAVQAGEDTINGGLLGVPSKVLRNGHNPARGLADQGMLPAITRTRLERGIGDRVPAIGDQIGSIVQNGKPVPLSGITSAIENPVNEARGIMEGPGAGNRSFEPIQSLQDSMMRRAPGASAPIYGPNAGTPFSADQVMDFMQRPQRLLNAPVSEIPLGSTPQPPQMPGGLFDAQRFPPQNVGEARIIRDAQGRILPFADRNVEFPDANGQLPTARNYNGQFLTRQPTRAAWMTGIDGELPPTPEFSGPGVLLRQPEFGQSAASPFDNLRNPYASSNDVWQTRLNVDKNTRFNPDPEVEGVNEVRRDIRNGLQNQLVQANPELAHPSQSYGDLRAAQEALEKKPSKGLGKLMDLTKTPVLSTAGFGLMKGGGIAGDLTANPFLNRIPGAASLFYGAPKNRN